MEIIRAERKDIPALYALQQLAFESEAEMIGSRLVPALLETEEAFRADFANWDTWKLVDDAGGIVGAIRCRAAGDVIEVGRLMIRPDCRRQGLARQLLDKVGRIHAGRVKELYTCTKSWSNIRLYESVGYRPYRECMDECGLPVVYMRKE